MTSAEGETRVSWFDRFLRIVGTGGLAMIEEDLGASPKQDEADEAEGDEYSILIQLLDGKAYRGPATAEMAEEVNRSFREGVMLMITCQTKVGLATLFIRPEVVGMLEIAPKGWGPA